MPGKLLSIIILLALLSCKKSGNVIDRSDFPPSSSMDVSYGSNPSQKMDIYLPGGRTRANTKFLVMVHGGGWTGGDKGEFNAIIARFQTILPDYAFFNINYRLFDGTNNKYPAQEEDVQSAINYILSKTDEYSISHKMVLMGASAGAQLALLQAYKHLLPLKARAVVSFYGPTDLVEFYNNPPSPALQPSLNALFGFSPEQNLSAYQQASPTFFVNGQSAATLILHGNLDQLVPVSQSILLKNRLQAAGVNNQLVVYPYEAHGWTGASLEDSYNQVQAFLAAHVN
jgi:acetyl esterase/lipase